MRESKIETPSQAIRVLVSLGLDRASKLDETWRAAAWSEGVRTAYADVQTKLMQSMTGGAKRG